jgi:hypothetical protein
MWYGIPNIEGQHGTLWQNALIVNKNWYLTQSM